VDSASAAHLPSRGIFLRGIFLRGWTVRSGATLSTPLLAMAPEQQPGPDELATEALNAESEDEDEGEGEGEGEGDSDDEAYSGDDDDAVTPPCPQP